MKMCIYFTTNGGSIFRIVKQLFYAHFIYDMVVEISTVKVPYTLSIFRSIKAIAWVK